MKKNSRPFSSAVIVAAGRGSRMNMELNKQYVEISGKPVLARTIQVFEDSDYIDEIILVVNQQEIVFCKQNIIDCYEFTKVKTLVSGGSQRQSSVYNGLLEVSKEAEIVLVHDGARPFVSQDSLTNSIVAAVEYGAACIAVPVKDTIKIADEDGFIKQTIDRSTLWSIQTPQTFRYDIIMNAHIKAIEDGFLGTDDAVLAERSGWKVRLVMGDYNNIKITTQEDIAIAEAIASEVSC